MANSLIPYSFVPGTKAMASEVNANFIALAQAVEDSKTFTTESIEDFNTELEERLDESLGAKLETNLANSGNISNCIIEVPKNVNLEFSNAVITLKAGSIVTVPSGYEDDGITPKFESVTIESDISVSPTYSSITEAYLLYVNENLYTVGINDTTFSYDTSANIIKKEGYYTGASFPIAMITLGPDSSNLSIKQIFNGMGFIGGSMWLLKGMKFLMPNGLNADGTLNNLELTTTKVIVYTYPAEWTRPMQPVMLHGITNLGIMTTTMNNRYYEAYTDPDPDSDYVTWLNLGENRMYHSDAEPGKYSIVYECFLGYVNLVSGKIKSFSPRKVVKLMDSSQNPLLYAQYCTNPGGTTSTANKVTPAVVVQNYKSGTNWYRIWSDGWIEQGGRGGGSYSKTFLKPFNDTNYTLLVIPLSGDGSNDNCMVNAISTTGFTAWVESNNSGFWYACGY